VARFSDLRFEHLVAAGEAIGLQKKVAVGRLEQQLSRIADEAQSLHAQTEEENGRWATRGDVGNTLPGEMRLLLTIVHVVIKDMVKQLTPV
jgi:serine/threonine-protein kinase HipA